MLHLFAHMQYTTYTRTLLQLYNLQRRFYMENAKRNDHFDENKIIFITSHIIVWCCMWNLWTPRYISVVILMIPCAVDRRCVWEFLRFSREKEKSHTHQNHRHLHEYKHIGRIEWNWWTKQNRNQFWIEPHQNKR